MSAGLPDVDFLYRTTAYCIPTLLRAIRQCTENTAMSIRVMMSDLTKVCAPPRRSSFRAAEKPCWRLRDNSASGAWLFGFVFTGDACTGRFGSPESVIGLIPLVLPVIHRKVWLCDPHDGVGGKARRKHQADDRKKANGQRVDFQYGFFHGYSEPDGI